MRKDWVGEKVDISQINRGKEYTIDDNLEISAINSIVKNSIYASEIAEETKEYLDNFNPELKNISINDGKIPTEYLSTITLNGITYQNQNFISIEVQLEEVD